MNVILLAIISLGAIGAIAAIVLFVISKKFAVEEDPRVGQIEACLPGANCGGCGQPGCHAFAEACVKTDDLSKMLCPVGGAETMAAVGKVLGLEVGKVEPKVAVIRCNGSCENRPRLAEYDGATSCVIAAATTGGETGCSYGCLGLGDCVAACQFDALHINEETGLPEVDEDKCTACGACVTACPKNIIELRKKGPKSRRVYVSCVNQDKGAVARKACSAACIGCMKCAKTCPFDAITVENNVAYIDFEKCRLCQKCVAVCPTGAIHAVNFPPKKKPVEKKVEAVNTTATKSTEKSPIKKQPVEKKEVVEEVVV